MTWHARFIFSVISNSAFVWVAGSSPSAGAIPADFRLEYTRGPYEGSCPEYSVTVGAAGHVRWFGRSSVKRKGRATKTISPKAVDDIVAVLNTLHLEGMRTDLRCIDTPQLSMTVTMHGTRASIRQNYCDDAPTAASRRVDEVGKKLDQLIGVASWVGTAQERNKSFAQPRLKGIEKSK